jgi:hypothetical protein
MIDEFSMTSSKGTLYETELKLDGVKVLVKKLYEERRLALDLFESVYALLSVEDLDFESPVVKSVIFAMEKLGYEKEFSEAFKSGYETGERWKEAYTPGGPWIQPPTIRASADREYDVHHARSVKCNNYWRKGFDLGKKVKAHKQ